MTNIEKAIVKEMITAMEALGAKSDLLCIVGSFKDTLDDEVVLDNLASWNEENKINR